MVPLLASLPDLLRPRSGQLENRASRLWMEADAFSVPFSAKPCWPEADRLFVASLCPIRVYLYKAL
jgi:hypothetical protein